MPKTGILSILPNLDARSQHSFDRLYHLVGQNTGNLLFTNAVWNQIGGPKERFSFSFDPEKLNSRLSALVIPAANWLGPTVDFSDLADCIERLTIPVVLIGLGAQDASYSGSINVPEGTVRLVKAVAARSASISVRGEYTKQILNGLGVQNVTVTGCPSLYHDFRRFTQPPSKPHVRADRGLIHSTRYSASYAPFAKADSVHRRLFRFAFARKLDILFQSEPEEMAWLAGLTKAGGLDDQLRSLLMEIYDAGDWDKLVAYWQAHGKVFYDVDEWSRSLDAYDYVLGTRLHGTIMALNSGVPAALVYHDSRTREMAEFAAIPSISAEQLRLDSRSVEALFRKADLDRYYQRRKENHLKYQAFLKASGLNPADGFGLAQEHKTEG
ncbi:polysaccharide pyruvyl transferase family protein [Hyphomonas jannaschiana]|uniref:polysaccharide pyruvyl transferase family protein n=1 Tax=Hyphomonas jannaschiana TaxID=86 RepID=UPI0009DE055A|nr:polysaccharide pyruvyl transferase family protein [Hyphomonas jannaschiana]